MRQEVSQQLFAYWSTLKGARSAPDRSDIDPSAIRGALADTFIIEIDGSSQFPIRLSGARLNALWLKEQKGESFLDFWRKEDQRSVAAMLLTVIDGVTPIVAGARARSNGPGRLDLELLLLPLRHFGKTHSRILGSLAPNYQPDWLGVASAGPLELLSLRILDGATIEKPARVSVHQDRRRKTVERPRLIVLEGGKPL